MAFSSSATSATVRAHRAGGVLRDGNRNDARAAHQPHRRFQADEPVHRRGTDDAAVGLGADADGGEAGGDCRAGAGARSARVAIEHVRILRLSTARAPAGGGSRGAEVRPFAQVRLAEDHGAGIAQALHEEGVPRGRCSAIASEPAEFTMPATSMLSLIRTGMPCSGPRTLPAFRSRRAPRHRRARSD